MTSPISIFRQAEPWPSISECQQWRQHKSSSSRPIEVSAGSAAVLTFILIFELWSPQLEVTSIKTNICFKGEEMSKYNWDERHIITFLKKGGPRTKDLHVYYGTNESIKGRHAVWKNKITALIGPSDQGNQPIFVVWTGMNDTIDIARVTGEIWYEGMMSIAQGYQCLWNAYILGWFSNGPSFAKSIYKHHLPAWISAGVKDKCYLGRIGRNFGNRQLRDQVKDDLHKSA